MSGGVDSSVAAHLLLEAGYSVTGVFMCLGTAGDREGDSRGCCSPQDAADARRVADRLGIDLFVLNLQEQFDRIIAYFAAEYERGRTPNPCVQCNAMLKFGCLMDRAAAIGARYVATGHYARLAATGGSTLIARARHRQKDQSYALFAVPAEHLGRMLLPIGELEDKSHVREIARSMGLCVSDKPDSQEICFAPEDDYTRVLRLRAPGALRPGEIVNAAGEVLGMHEGYARFTIGQRRGLRVAAGSPMYVTGIDPATARVTIGPRQEVMATRVRASGANWHRPMAGDGEFEAIVQVRYNHQGAAARVRLTGPTSFEAVFHEPVAAITPGQGAVVYDGDTMLGGGWIDG